VKAKRSRAEFALLFPHLSKQPLPAVDLFDPDNIEFALLLLPQEAWSKLIEPKHIEREDGTWQTGDSFFDDLENALASGENINDVISRLQPS